MPFISRDILALHAEQPASIKHSDELQAEQNTKNVGNNNQAAIAKHNEAVQPEGGTRCSDQSSDCKVKTLTCSLTGLAPLFTPMSIGSLALSHRIILAPLTRLRASAEGVPNTELAGTYYAQRTTKGGLLISEATNISEEAIGKLRTPGIYTSAQVEAWKGITDAVHKKGGFFFLQLRHTGRASHSAYQPNGRPPVGPSPIAIKGEIGLPDGSVAPFEVPRELRAQDEIPAILADYKNAARNAFLAGFDGVEIHGNNGYLIDQFLHNGSNKRTDSYGGSVQNRSRFLFEVVEAVQQGWREAVGQSSLKAQNIGLRLAPFGTYYDMSDTNEKELYNYVLSSLNKYKLAYVHLVEPRVTVNNAKNGSGDNKDTIGEVELVHTLGNQFEGPIITAGGYRPDASNCVIHKAAHANPPRNVAVAFGRLFISNPDFPLRVFLQAPVVHYNRATFYTHEAAGYTDQPFLTDTEVAEYTKALRAQCGLDNEKVQHAIDKEIQLLRA